MLSRSQRSPKVATATTDIWLHVSSVKAWSKQTSSYQEKVAPIENASWCTKTQMGGTSFKCQGSLETDLSYTRSEQMNTGPSDIATHPKSLNVLRYSCHVKSWNEWPHRRRKCFTKGYRSLVPTHTSQHTAVTLTAYRSVAHTAPAW